MSFNSTVSLIWFRRDLRIHDSEIVTLATEQQQVLPFFIIDPWFYEQPEVSSARVKFLFESLENLDLNLRAKGSRLYLFEGRSLDIIKSLTLSLIEREQQPQLYFHRDVQVEYGIDRDRAVLDFYQEHNLNTYIGLNHFMQVEQEDYSSWWKDYHNHQQQPVYPTPEQINNVNLDLNLPQLTIYELKEKYRWFIEAASYRYLGGETFAQKTLETFVSHRYQGYHWKMSRPWQAQQGATSHLSAHLDFGTISSRTVYQAVRQLKHRLPDKSKAQYSVKTFLDRLRWHDKFTQRHYHHPELAWRNRYPEFDKWYSNDDLDSDKQKLFAAWCEGRTGYPMVDASMRQLNRIGWMNFRMRAMCVTFLTINCGVSWHHGARYFMSRLVDGNIAINHWQWQAQAGSLNPMSKTFRIYNPTKNLQTKDPSLEFIYCWIPELRGHSMQQILAGEYKFNYPQPILDWKQTRKVNGKVVADLRKQVRARLEQEQGEEYHRAIGARDTVDKYFAIKNQQYQEVTERKLK